MSNRGREMNRKRISMSILIAGVSLGYCAAQAFGAEGGGGPGVPGKPPHADLAPAGLKAAATANLFRLSAAGDIAAAVQGWGSPAFRAKWEKEIEAVFSKEERIELHDFFSSAVVWVGGLRGPQSVVAFYSPWADGLCVATMDAGGKEPKLTDFAFISGESLRGGESVKAEASFTLYELKEPLIIAVARLYGPSVAAFTRLYPPEGEPLLLPGGLKARLEAPAAELLPIKARMMVRMKMFKDYFAAPNRAWVVECGALMKTLKTGEAKALLAALAEGQDAALVETLCALPAAIRGDLGPNYFMKAGNGVVVGFVNPAAPRWLVAATYKGVAPGKRAARLELLDLELSGKAVKLWGEEGAQ